MVEAGEEDAGRLADGIGDDPSLGKFKIQCGLDQLPGISSNSTAQFLGGDPQ